MSDAFIPEQLFVHDETEMSDGNWIGTFNIKNKETSGEGCKWIGDVKPYGSKYDQFPEHEEAKAYAKLFAASPDMITELKENHEFLLRMYNSINTYGNAVNLDQIQTEMRDRMAKQLPIIAKATT